MKPDAIVAWPRHADYPLWRQLIHDERSRLGRVLVVFTEHDGADYTGFVAEAMAPDRVECLWSPPRGERDWRDVAVNAALDRSDAEWVWFTEQDFLISDPAMFWWRVEFSVDFGQVRSLGWRADTRWHPSCLFVQRTVVEATDRYFGPDPVDHFGTFGQQIGPVYDLVAQGDLGGTFEHLQGVSQNHHLLAATGSLDDPGIFARERFTRYLAESLAVTVPLHPAWAAAASRAIGRSVPHAAGT